MPLITLDDRTDDSRFDPKVINSKIKKFPAPALERFDDVYTTDHDQAGLRQSRYQKFRSAQEHRDSVKADYNFSARQKQHVRKWREKDDERLRELADDLARANAAVEKAHAESRLDLLPNHTRRILDWVRDHKADYVIRAVPLKIKSGGEDEALASVMAKRDKLKAQRRSIELAPLPLAEILPTAFAIFDQAAERGKPDVSRVTRMVLGPDNRRRQGAVRLPTVSTGSGMELREIPDAFAMMAWAFGDQFKAALEKEIAASMDFANAIPASERKPRIAKFDAELITLEYEEAELVSRIRQRGGTSWYRHDLSVAALLGLETPPLDPAKFTALDGGESDNEDIGIREITKAEALIRN